MVADGKLERNTPQRAVILEELRMVKSHPTAVELHELVRRRLPKISLGTVYRNLERLSRKGAIRKLTTGQGETCFDGDLAPHYHVRCIHCGRLDDVFGLSDLPVPREGALFGGYQVLGHRLEFDGICPSCQEKSESRETARAVLRDE